MEVSLMLLDITAKIENWIFVELEILIKKREKLWSFYINFFSTASFNVTYRKISNTLTYWGRVMHICVSKLYHHEFR